MSAGKGKGRGGGGGDRPPTLLAPPGNAPIGQAKGTGRTAATGRVRNRNAASVQITAEQLILEAREAAVQIDPSLRKDPGALARATAEDAEEIADYRAHRRREYERLVRSASWKLKTWVDYAKWEISQGDMRRARSVYERALEVDHTREMLWRSYAEAEMAAGQPGHARNVWHRAVSTLPRCNNLWLRWALMEQSLGDQGDARGVFSSWVKWHPPAEAWNAWVNYEVRSGHIAEAREVYEMYVKESPTVATWIKYASFEEAGSRRALARAVFERAASTLGDAAISEDDAFYLAFATFEERSGEDERARAIYKHAVQAVPRAGATQLYRRYIDFEKKRGDRDGIEAVVIGKRRVQYEEEVTADPTDYDKWFEYARLEEASGDYARARAVYIRAQSHPPPTNRGKGPWRRFIFLYLNHALMEELDAGDEPRARAAYEAAVQAVPHRRFSFSKLWTLYADFELRHMHLDAARKVLGRAIGNHPKDRIFERYLAIESALGEVDRCRKLYARWLECDPGSTRAWLGFAQMEASLGEVERSRAVLELCIGRDDLDCPEAAWKRFIDAEAAWGETERARKLFERLAERTEGHVRVWMAWAEFEIAAGPGDGADPSGEFLERVRGVYRRGEQSLKDAGAEQSDARATLLRAWSKFEQQHGDDKGKADMEARKPRRVTREQVDPSTGEKVSYEEWVFPEPLDEGPKDGAMKILEMALKWKKQKTK